MSVNPSSPGWDRTAHFPCPILVSTNSTSSYQKNQSSPHFPTKFLHSAGTPCPLNNHHFQVPHFAASKQKLLGVSFPAYINWGSSTVHQQGIEPSAYAGLIFHRRWAGTGSYFPLHSALYRFTLSIIRQYFCWFA